MAQNDRVSAEREQGRLRCGTMTCDWLNGIGVERALFDHMLAMIEKLYKAQEFEMRSPKPSAGDAAMIAELRADIPAPVLAHYDRLRSRGKKGVSVVRNNVCTGCHMGVSIGTIVTLKQGKDIQLCGSCGRYLYLPPEEPAAPEPPVPEAKPKRKRRSSKPSSDAS